MTFKYFDRKRLMERFSLLFRGSKLSTFLHQTPSLNTSNRMKVLLQQSRNMAGGPNRPTSNRAKRGLYAGKDILFGNKVSHSERKTRRTFKPNAHTKSIWSDTLQEMIRFNLTTNTLRMIDKHGGLDNYLLETADDKLNSVSGLKIKKKILEVQKMNKRHGKETMPDPPKLKQQWTLEDVGGKYAEF